MASSDSFVHLHVHTEYSMLDGAARVGELFDAAAEQGMPAIAITDHGNRLRRLRLLRTARKRGVKPIIGIEAYLTPGTHRTERRRVKWGDGGNNSSDDVSGGGAYTHMTLLAENTGACTTSSGWPRWRASRATTSSRAMDRELLQTYGQGLIATTGCPSRGGADPAATRPVRGGRRGGRRVPGHLRRGQLLTAKLMDHGLDIERRAQRGPAPARQGARPAAGGDQRPALHAPEDAQAHAASAVRPVRHRPWRIRTGSSSTASELLPEDAGTRCANCSGDLPEACDNTLLIAERATSVHRGRGPSCRGSRARTGENEESWFVKEVETRTALALSRRRPRRGPQAGGVRDRASSPQMGFPGYFLVVADFINWAKEQRHPGRSGPWLRRRLDVRLRDADHRPRPAPARPDLRALPQPGARCRCPTSTSTSTSAAAAR